MNIRVLIVGAGSAGNTVLRGLKNHQDERIPAGFVDDDKKKIGLEISGLPVLGNRFDIPEIITRHKIKEVIIAIPSAPAGEISKIVELCKKTKARVKILPGTYDLISGKIQLSPIRDVQLEELLGRKPLILDTEEIIKYLNDEVVLITGAGGSVGMELASHVANNNPARLILLGRGENSIYMAEQKLKDSLSHVDIVSEIADIKDRNRITKLFRRYKPGVIFHAAAHKHVPYMEKSPEEAVKNNILGTKVLCDAAIECGSQKFILISTDKAVKPASIMGATKRVAEIIALMMNNLGKTKFAAVRFGNILGSRGSVLPLFERQIETGGPVTITHPEMTRYFMTVNEAAQLVIQAGAMANGGEIFILDMGEPICIKDLAWKLIKLKGLNPDEDIYIKYIGIRPGEKIFETLVWDEEKLDPTKHKKIFSVSNTSNINYQQVKSLLETLENKDFSYNDNEIRKLLRSMN